MHARIVAVALIAQVSIVAAEAVSRPQCDAGSIAIGHPWARAMAPATLTGAAYMTLTNTGASPTRLLAAASPVAERVEVHTLVNDGGVTRMRPVEDGIALPPGETASLAPGGLHLMLIGLRRPLHQGERVPLTLRFERAGDVTVELAVEPASAPGADPSGHSAQDNQRGGSPAKSVPSADL